MLTPYTSALQTRDDVTQKLRGFIRSITDLQGASEGYGIIRKSPDYFTLQILFYYEAKDYDKVVEIASQLGNALPVQLTKSVAWSHIMIGNRLWEQAKSADARDADRIYSEVYKSYEMATSIKPNHYEALSNWGCALADQAKNKLGNEADDLYARAKEKFKSASTLNPRKNQALNNWGCVLVSQAKTKIGKEADLLFAEAVQRFQEALVIKNKDSYALSNWGNAVLWQAQSKLTSEKMQLMKTAEEKLRMAEMISPGIGAYDLACIAAQTGDEALCKKWLEVSRKYDTLPALRAIEEDVSFVNVRDSDWFRVLLNDLNAS
ncbi:hypothetical protein HUU05_09065 [candidate division KSB1 bacterium]|nr:hypothetical protein [candidate division KSB1 bacterium]